MKLAHGVAWLAVLAASCATATPAPSGAPSVAPAASAQRVAAPVSPAHPTNRSDGSEAAAQRRVENFLARVAAARHLEPLTRVDARELDRAALIASVRDHVAREIPRDVIRNQGELLVGLGLVPPDFDYEEGAFRLLEAQLAGFYEPHDKKMYLASDLPDRAADATLAHELVHALQDQHYDLGTRLAYQPDANDRESALQGLAEGDATSAMMDLLLKDTRRRAIDVPDRVFAAEVEGSMTTEAEGERVPRVLRASLVAPYVDGVLFVHAVRRRSLALKGARDDGGWSAVDDVWAKPPETTEQLLHLEKYDAHEAADVVPTPASPGPEWTTTYEDVFGEQGLRIAVEEWLPGDKAASLAHGWGGDRVALFRSAARDAPTGSGGTVSLAVAWHIRFDRGEKVADSEAREAFQALAEIFRPGKRGSPLCIERGQLGPLSVAQSGRDLVITAGPYRRDRKRVASDSICTKSLRWAADVLGKNRR